MQGAKEKPPFPPVREASNKTQGGTTSSVRAQFIASAVRQANGGSQGIVDGPRRRIIEVKGERYEKPDNLRCPVPFEKHGQGESLGAS